MHRWKQLALVLTLAISSSLASAETIGDLLFDNYLPNGSGGWDGVSFFSSELTAAVATGDDPEPGSWAADDAVFAEQVIVQEIEWLGLFKTGYEYVAEVLIMDDEFVEVAQFEGLDFEAIETGETFFGLQRYDGSVELPDDGLVLDAGHYYVAVRLENRTAGGALGGGRNVMLGTSTGDPNAPTNPAGLTEGAVKIPAFGYDDWTLISDTGQDPVDYAYRIYGEVVPEPSALFLILSGVVFARRRQ